MKRPTHGKHPRRRTHASLLEGQLRAAWCVPRPRPGLARRAPVGVGEVWFHDLGNGYCHVCSVIIHEFTTTNYGTYSLLFMLPFVFFKIFGK